MKKSIDRRLVVDGKYNMKAIMQRAWAYKNDMFCTRYRNDFKGALKAAWTDAHIAMDDYKASLVKKEPFKHKTNILKEFFVSAHPEYRHYDSSWL